MLLDWNKQTIRWFEAADEWTGYGENLAKLLKERILHAGTLLDIGCGMALPDFSLAKDMKSITCVDSDERVISYVQSRILKQGIANMEALTMMGQEVRGQWDTVMCIFHGGLDTILHHYLPLARDTLLVVVHAAKTGGNIAPEGYKVRKCSGIEETSAYFHNKGISFELFEGSLEYGQPLTSVEEGEAFLRTYSRRDTPAQALQEELQARLVPTYNRQYPFYLPSRKEFGLYTIRRS